MPVVPSYRRVTVMVHALLPAGVVGQSAPPLVYLALVVQAFHKDVPVVGCNTPQIDSVGSSCPAVIALVYVRSKLNSARARCVRATDARGGVVNAVDANTALSLFISAASLA